MIEGGNISGNLIADEHISADVQLVPVDFQDEHFSSVENPTVFEVQNNANGMGESSYHNDDDFPRNTSTVSSIMSANSTAGISKLQAEPEINDDIDVSENVEASQLSKSE